MTQWNHALVQNADDQNVLCPREIEDHVLAFLHAAKVRIDWIAGSTKPRLVRKDLKCFCEPAQLTQNLFLSPAAQSVVADVNQISFRLYRERIQAHDQAALDDCLDLFVFEAGGLNLSFL